MLMDALCADRAIYQILQLGRAKTMRNTIQRSVSAAIALACFSISSATIAQGAFPTKPVRIIVPFAASGPTDTGVRLLVPYLNTAMGQAVIVENKPGGGTRIGMDEVAKSAPDGYTLGAATAAAAANEVFYPERQYSLLRSLRGVSFLTQQGVLLAVNPAKLPASSFKEFIAYAKSHPGVTYGFAGFGTGVHLLMEEINQAYQTGVVLVPYKGAAAAVAALGGDQQQSAGGGWPAYIPFVGNPKVRILATSGENRIDEAKDIPTFAELGYESLSKHRAWFAVVAPKETPDSTVAYLNRHINGAIESVKDRYIALSFGPKAMTPSQLDAYMREDVTRIAAIVKKGNIKLN